MSTQMFITLSHTYNLGFVSIYSLFSFLPSFLLTSLCISSCWITQIPPALLRLPDKVTAPTSSSGMQGCAYCGGLGHSILECPKYRSTVQSKLKGNYAYDRIDSNM